MIDRPGRCQRPATWNAPPPSSNGESIVGDSVGDERSETTERHRSGGKAMQDAVQDLFNVARAEVVDRHLDGQAKYPASAASYSRSAKEQLPMPTETSGSVG